jgi:hypothetical protein
VGENYLGRQTHVAERDSQEEAIRVCPERFLDRPLCVNLWCMGFRTAGHGGVSRANSEGAEALERGIPSDEQKDERDYCGQGSNTDDNVGRPPAEAGDEILEDRRRDKAHAETGPKEAEDEASPPGEPVGDDGTQRRDADETEADRDHDAVQEIEMPGLSGEAAEGDA